MSSKQRIICASVSRPPAGTRPDRLDARAGGVDVGLFHGAQRHVHSKQFVRNTGGVWISLRACR